jgi:hypothetical protein
MKVLLNLPASRWLFTLTFFTFRVVKEQVQVFVVPTIYANLRICKGIPYS